MPPERSESAGRALNRLRILEIACVFLRLNHIASFFVNANHGIM
jgi:hypothetical protein